MVLCYVRNMYGNLLVIILIEACWIDVAKHNIPFQDIVVTEKLYSSRSSFHVEHLECAALHLANKTKPVQSGKPTHTCWTFPLVSERPCRRYGHAGQLL